MTIAGLRVGYAPYAPGMDSPGDRRRFCFYARARGIEVSRADPRQDYDLVYLSTRADIAAWSRYRGRAKVVFELIDSYLALPPRGLKNILRGVAKFASREVSRPILNYHRALEVMCRRADAVVCSTEEQRENLLRLCPNVHVILDVHEEIDGKPKSDFSSDETLNLAWEGLAYTVGAFRAVAPALQSIARIRPVALHLVTDLRFGQYLSRFVQRDTRAIVRKIFPRTYLYEWNPHLLADIVTACDIALIPLDLEDPFSLGKPENKLLIFWKMAMPTITSASPSYRRAMKAAGLDMTCETPADWESTILRYADDETARRRAGEAGWGFVNRHHSTERILERWDALMMPLLG